MPKIAVAELADRHPWLPYAAPFVLFVGLTGVQGWVPGSVVWVYPLKAALTGALLLTFARWLEAPGESRFLGAAGVGIAVLAVWILTDGLYPLLDPRAAFDPTSALHGAGAWTWIAVRLLGAAVVVPFAEEFFWRGFLIRWLVRADFRSVPMGTFTWYSFAATTGLFAVEHDRWLTGLIAGAAYNGLYYRTRSLKACIVAHATTNLGLGIYVLVSHQWRFW